MKNEITKNSDNFWRDDKHRYYGIADEIVRIELKSLQLYLEEMIGEKQGRKIYNKVYDICFNLISKK